MTKQNYAAFVFRFGKGVYFSGFHPGFLYNKVIYSTKSLVEAKRFDRENTEEFENTCRYMDELQIQYEVDICLFKREN